MFCLLFLFFQNLRNFYDRCVLLVEVWTALGVILTFLWPLGAVLHNHIQAMILDWIPLALLRLWELWSTLQVLWGYIN